MRYNLALASQNEVTLKQLCSELSVHSTSPFRSVFSERVQSAHRLFFSHFWYESSLSFDELEKKLSSLADISWFLSDRTRNSTSGVEFPRLIRTLEQNFIKCNLSALLNASFMEPGSLYIFDDYVETSGSSSGMVTGREYFFNSENPIILEMKRLRAIPQVFSETYMVVLDMAFRDTPPENSLSLYQQIAANVEALGTWYSIFSSQPAFNEARGQFPRYQKDWSLEADEKDRVFYISKP